MKGKFLNGNVPANVCSDEMEIANDFAFDVAHTLAVVLNKGQFIMQLRVQICIRSEDSINVSVCKKAACRVETKHAQLQVIDYRNYLSSTCPN